MKSRLVQILGDLQRVQDQNGIRSETEVLFRTAKNELADVINTYEPPVAVELMPRDEIAEKLDAIELHLTAMAMS